MIFKEAEENKDHMVEPSINVQSSIEFENGLGNP
jgi:hypothetical protein